MKRVTLRSRSFFKKTAARAREVFGIRNTMSTTTIGVRRHGRSRNQAHKRMVSAVSQLIITRSARRASRMNSPAVLAMTPDPDRPLFAVQLAGKRSKFVRISIGMDPVADLRSHQAIARNLRG